MRLTTHPYIRFGTAFCLLLILTAVFTPWIAPYPPDEIDKRARYQPPSREHWFGTDEVGRDVFSRVLYGSQISLGIGVSTRTFGLVIGICVGALSGYLGGKVDMLLQRVIDITLAFPFFLLVVAIAMIFPQGLTAVFFSLAAVMWAGMARLMRAQVLVAKNKEYVQAAKAFGASTPRILFRHILPNCLAVALIWWTLGLAQAIMAEAGLSFLGLGAQPPAPSWGGMINYGSQAIRVAPWVSLFPAAALALTVLAFNLLGEGLRDCLDPKNQHHYS
ncbi:MAG: ABC transporter permease [bacterium]|jgi:ABC-type dipeptide/oligopeptide/nickel transport system permease subunit|nr:ABC transporter permease [bacterium]